MTYQQLKKKSEGFTIIEVLIVLAIAGLILLIVFLAVPALQRSSRNTQRREDVGRVSSSATEVVSNNNGDTTSLDTTALQSALGTKLAYYDSTNITAVTALASGGSATNTTTIDTVVAVPNGKCNGTAANYANRRIAVLYSVENGSGGNTRVCLDQ